MPGRIKIFIGQIHIKAGISFPFSLRFQKWLGDALSELVEVSSEFSSKHGSDFGLGFRISAKDDIEEPEIKGPTIFKRDKTIEYSVFLPHKANDYHDIAVASHLVDQILDSVVVILPEVGLDASNVLKEAKRIRTEFLSRPGFIDAQKRPTSN